MYLDHTLDSSLRLCVRQKMWFIYPKIAVIKTHHNHPSSFFLLPSSFAPYPYGTLRERGSFNPYSSGEQNAHLQ
jgi:hypothetical protein